MNNMIELDDNDNSSTDNESVDSDQSDISTVELIENNNTEQIAQNIDALTESVNEFLNKVEILEQTSKEQNELALQLELETKKLLNQSMFSKKGLFSHINPTNTGISLGLLMTITGSFLATIVSTNIGFALIALGILIGAITLATAHINSTKTNQSPA